MSWPSRTGRSRFPAVALRNFRYLTWLLLSVSQLDAGLCAQREPLLTRGSHIEIVSEKLPDGIGVGWLISLSADTLTFVDTVAVTAVALEDIGQLRVNIGRDRAAMNVATLTGALLGAALASVASSQSFNCRFGLLSEDECGREVPTEVVGGLMGAGGLRMLSRFALDERWVNIRLDRLLYSVCAVQPP